MLFGGDDDDADFTLPTGGGSSKLASLFGIGQEKEEGNSSLTYMAPKQPKKTQVENTQKSSREGPPAQMNVMHAVAVNAYKLQDGNYSPVGKLGAAILGNNDICIYQLLLYRGKQEQVAVAKINMTFQFMVQPNNYTSFYDNQRQNWSMMFDSTADMTEFAKQVAVAKVNSLDGKLESVVIQDVILGEGPEISSGNMVEVSFTGWIFANKELGEVFDSTANGQKPLRFRLGKGKVMKGLEEGMVGMRKSGRRIVVVPPHMGYGNQAEAKVPVHSTLVYDIIVSNTRPGKEKDPSGLSRSETPVTQEGDKSGSGEDATVKARSASLSEALSSSPKSNKAHIISRMARMGQATLPMPSHVTSHPSDSSENEEEGTHEPVGLIHKPAVRPRAISSQGQPAFQTAPPAMHQEPLLSQQPLLPQQQPQPVAMYQSPLRAGFMPDAMYGIPVSYQSVPQVSTPVLNSGGAAIETHLSLLMSESRSQNTEVRIAVSRVSDRLEHIMSKVDQIHMLQQQHQQLQQLQQAGSMLYGVQATSALDHHRMGQITPQIQSLVLENSRLKQILEEKSEDALSEKSREVTSAEVERLEKLLDQMKCDLKDEKSKTGLLESQLEKAKEVQNVKQNEISALQKAVADVDNSAKLEKSLEEKQQQLEEEKRELCQEIEELKAQCQSSLMELRNKLEAEKKAYESNMRIDTEKEMEEKLQNMDSQWGKQLEAATAEKEELEAQLTQLQKRVHEMETNDSESEWKNKFLKLQEEQKSAEELEKQLSEVKAELITAQNTSKEEVSADEIAAERVKVVMNQLYRNLQAEFEPNKSYEGSHIRKILAATIRSVTLNLLEQPMSKNKKVPEGSPETSSPKSREKQAEPLTETSNSSSSRKVSSSSSDSDAKKEEDKAQEKCPTPSKKDASIPSSRDSSSERGWKPQPPPPPLFDDEDDDDDWPK